MLSVVRSIAAIAGLVFAGVAYHEWAYANAHRHAYGPARIIEYAAIAGLIVCGVVFGLEQMRQDLEKRFEALGDRVRRLERWSEDA